MQLHKKILIILVVALILIIVFLGGIFVIFNRTANAPAENSEFDGPTSIPYARGPNIPLPSN